MQMEKPYRRGEYAAALRFYLEHGSCCLAEVRCLETIADGAPHTPFMSFGDRIEIEMLDEEGQSIFGRIDQRVVQYTPAID